MFDLIKEITLWIAGKTGLTHELVQLISTLIVLPVLTFLTNKMDFVKMEKSIAETVENWKKLVYVFVYAKAQAFNDLFLKIPALGFIWEKWLEPWVIKIVASLIRILVRLVIGIVEIIKEIPLAIASGLNSRGESLVEEVEKGKR